MKAQDAAEILSQTIASTQLPIGTRHEGKVRDSYVRGGRRCLIATDRLSCFDVVVTTVPHKGAVLTALANYWFSRTAELVPNHVVAIPDPNCMVVQNCEILPVEVVVRAYLTGSAWRDYEAGRLISGVKLPSGMRADERLVTPILTPSTKAERGAHDAPISEHEIVTTGLVDAQVWDQVRSYALQLFEYGSRELATRGLILVDTKYEFGLLDGKVVLADEIHTLDSSRFWVADEYEERFSRGVPQRMLDKEPVRQWLLTQGFKGDGPIPHFSDTHRLEIMEHYLNAYHRLTGSVFRPASEPFEARLSKLLPKLEALLTSEA